MGTINITHIILFFLSFVFLNSMATSFAMELTPMQITLKKYTKTLDAGHTIVPNYKELALIVKTKNGINLITKIAHQDQLWSRHRKKILKALIKLIKRKNCMFHSADESQIAHVLDIFLTTSKSKGDANFIDQRLYFKSKNQSIIKACVMANFLECIGVALKHAAHLNIPWKDEGEPVRYPLLYAHLNFGIQSRMYNLLLQAGAKFLPQHEHFYEEAGKPLKKLL